MDFERRSIHGRAAKNMLCASVYTEDGDLMGLVQAINKRHGVFTRADEKLLHTLCAQSGVMMHHAHLLRSMHKQSQARFDLCQYSVNVLSCPDQTAMCKLVASHGAKVLTARKCVFWMHEPHRQTVWTVGVNDEIIRNSVREIATSVVGKAAVSAEIQIQAFSDLSGDVSDGGAEGDDEQERAQVGQRSQMGEQFSACILAQPVLSKCDRRVLGVIECVNKRGGVYDDDDKYVMHLFATITAAALENLAGTASVATSTKPVKSTQTVCLVE